MDVMSSNIISYTMQEKLGCLLSKFTPEHVLDIMLFVMGMYFDDVL
jgi:hypothetical protein